MMRRCLLLLQVLCLYFTNANQTVVRHAPEHSNCKVTDWTKENGILRNSNKLLTFVGDSTLVKFIKAKLDPISLPNPLHFRVRRQFLGTTYEINAIVETIKLYGISTTTMHTVKPTSPTSVSTGFNVESVYLDISLDLKFGQKTLRRYGMHYCPDAVQFWRIPRKCPVHSGSITVTLEVKDMDMMLEADVWVYDCDRKESIFGRAACKIASSWEYMRKLLSDGIYGVSEAFLTRFHDAHIRYTTVGFRKFDLTIHFESEFSVLLDPEIFGFINAQLDTEFRDGIFHDSICFTIATAIRDVANQAIDSVRPMFNQKHITV